MSFVLGILVSLASLFPLQSHSGDCIRESYVEKKVRHYALSMEAFQKKEISPRLSLATSLILEGGANNYKIARKVLITGLGFGSLSPSSFLNYGELNLLRLCSFTLGYHMQQPLAPLDKSAALSIDEKEFRVFYDRGRLFLPRVSEDFDEEDDSETETDGVITHEAKIESIPDEDLLLVAAKNFVREFSAGTSPRDFLMRLVDPLLYSPAILNFDKSDAENINRWVNRETLEGNFMINIVKASLIALENPDADPEILKVARENLDLGANYFLRSEFIKQYPNYFRNFTNSILRQDNVRLKLRIYYLAKPFFTWDHWESFFKKPRIKDDDLFINYLKLTISQGLRAILSAGTEDLAHLDFMISELRNIKSALENFCRFATRSNMSTRIVRRLPFEINQVFCGFEPKFPLAFRETNTLGDLRKLQGVLGSQIKFMSCQVFLKTEIKELKVLKDLHFHNPRALDMQQKYKFALLVGNFLELRQRSLWNTNLSVLWLNCKRYYESEMKGSCVEDDLEALVPSIISDAIGALMRYKIEIKGNRDLSPEKREECLRNTSSKLKSLSKFILHFSVKAI